MKAIIFDCDGTLVDSEMTHYNAWSHALKKHNYSFTMEEYAAYVGTPMKKTCVFLSHKVGKDCADELKRDKHEFYQSKIKIGIPPIHGTVSFLHELAKEQKKYHYKLAVASGAAKEEILVYLRHLKVEHLFDVILSGKDDLKHYTDPEGVNKPKPYIYLEAAKQLGLKPSECVAVEDSYPGVMSGVNAGCFTIAIPHDFSRNHDFSASHLIIPCLKNYTVERFLQAVQR